MRWWVDSLGQALGRPVDAVAALEYTSLGWPHWHGLVASGGIDNTEFKRASRLWYDRHGYSLLKRVTPGNARGISGYICKYLTKSNSDVQFLSAGGARWGVYQAITDPRYNASGP